MRASVTLDEANIPQEGRFAVIPPWVHGLLLENDPVLSAKTDAVLNGEVGQVAGFRLLKSNNVPTTGTSPVVYHVMVGHPMAITYAEQIAKVEAYRPEAKFGDALKGLHLYGSKTVRPQALLDLQAKK